MKIIRKITKICILLFVGIALFILFSAFPKTALAVDDNIVVDNEHYVDFSSLDTTSYYREYAVTNREVAYKKGGDIFAFENGASVVKNDLNTLVFKLNLLKPEYEKGKVFLYLQSFVVYECSSDSMTATPIADVVISHVCTGDVQEEAVFFKRFQYSDVKVGIKQYLKGMDDNVGVSPVTFAVGYLNDGYDLISLRKGIGKSLFINGGNSLEIAIKGSSPYTRYFVRSASYLAMEGRNNYIEETLDSSVVSVYDVLKNLSMSETLDSLGDKKEAAEHIVYNFATQKVQIMYLKRIGTTPFATTARAYVDVPVAENEIRVADVKNALGLDTMAVMQSSCDYFKYDSAEDIYRAYYYKSVWLSAKTADGNNQDLYLDCNLSFKDFYEPLVRDGILPIGDNGYEYFFNRMKYNFPELEGLKEHEVYGYFGYVALPKTYTFYSCSLKFSTRQKQITKARLILCAIWAIFQKKVIPNCSTIIITISFREFGMSVLAHLQDMRRIIILFTWIRGFWNPLLLTTAQMICKIIFQGSVLQREIRQNLSQISLQNL